MSNRYVRQMRYGRLGWIAFAVCLACAVIAIWSHDGRWLATSGVALVAAIGLGLAWDATR